MMTDNKDEITELIARAINGEHSKFEFIKNWAQAAFVVEYYHAMKKIVKAIKKAHKELYKQYLIDVSQNNNDSIATIGGIYQLDACIKFYTAEKELTYDMLDEFYCYCLLGKNLTSILAGEERPQEHLQDYREKRLKF